MSTPELCPTCGTHVNRLGCKVFDRPFWMCMMCGTHTTCDGDGNGPITVVPDLVRGVRELHKSLTSGGVTLAVAALATAEFKHAGLDVVIPKES